jgi:phosphoenolpyruvate carboxylase
MGHVSNDRELKEAYECGYEEGYEDAMRELEGKSTHGRMRKY